MTERTHDLAGLTTLVIAFTYLPLTSISMITLAVVVLANQLGTAFPDFDQPTAEIYRELPAGSLIGYFFSPLLGGHRHISHSILGMCLYGWLFHLLFTYLSRYLTADMNLIWWSFILGYFSHLVMDSLTKEGVPWLFPIPIRFGFPPLKQLRITTGKFLEKIVVYPLLLTLNGYLLYLNYNKVVEFLSNHVTH